MDVNDHTLADFRIAPTQWLKQQIVAVIAVMRKEGLIDLSQVER